MKAVQFALAGVLLASSLAWADIPSDPRGHSSTSITLGASESASLYQALDVEERTEYSLRTTDGKYKVWRSESGLAQIVCNAQYDKGAEEPKSVSCTVSQSKDGRALPRYKPRRILG